MKKLNSLIQKAKDTIMESEAVLKIKAKFNELDAKSQTIAITSTIAGSALLLVLILTTVIYGSISTKLQIKEIDDTIQYLHSSVDKMDTLRRKIREKGVNSSPLSDLDKSLPLPEFSEKVASRAAINKQSIEAKGSEQSAEIKISKISLRQLMRFLFFIETAKNGVHIEKLVIDEKDDPKGFMWATITLNKTITKPIAGANKKSGLTK